MTARNWPTPAGRGGRAVAVRTEGAAEAAARHQGEADRLAAEAFTDLMDAMATTADLARACAGLKALPPGLSQIAGEVRDHTDARVSIAQNILLNLRR